LEHTTEVARAWIHTFVANGGTTIAAPAVIQERGPAVAVPVQENPE
jgi:hypothetical protein